MARIDLHCVKKKKKKKTLTNTDLKLEFSKYVLWSTESHKGLEQHESDNVVETKTITFLGKWSKAELTKDIYKYYMENVVPNQNV